MPSFFWEIGAKKQIFIIFEKFHEKSKENRA